MFFFFNKISQNMKWDKCSSYTNFESQIANCQFLYSIRFYISLHLSIHRFSHGFYYNVLSVPLSVHPFLLQLCFVRTSVRPSFFTIVVCVHTMYVCSSILLDFVRPSVRPSFSTTVVFVRMSVRPSFLLQLLISISVFKFNLVVYFGRNLVIVYMYMYVIADL